MRNLKNMEGKGLVTNQEKVDGLVGDLFGWADNLGEDWNRRQGEEREEYREFFFFL